MHINFSLSLECFAGDCGGWARPRAADPAARRPRRRRRREGHVVRRRLRVVRVPPQLVGPPTPGGVAAPTGWPIG